MRLPLDPRAKGICPLLVSEEDRDLADGFNWGLYRGYWGRKVKRNGVQHTIYLSREIGARMLGVSRLDRQQEVDHINHDTLDNRRENLRVVTPQQNKQNRAGTTSNSRSLYRGVTCCHKKNGPKWLAQAHMNGRSYYGGYHETAEQAADAAALLRKRLGFLEGISA